MGALFYYIHEGDAVKNLLVKGRFNVSGRGISGKVWNPEKEWIKDDFFKVFPSQNGWAINRFEGPQKLMMNGWELPAGESFLLKDETVLLAVSPDMTDYFILFFRENDDSGGMKWMKLNFEKMSFSKRLPFSSENGQWQIYPDRTDLTVSQYGKRLTEKMHVYAGSVFMIGDRLVIVMREGLLFTDDAMISNVSLPLPDCREEDDHLSDSHNDDQILSKSSDQLSFHGSEGHALSNAEDGVLRIDINERSVKHHFRKKILLKDIHLDMRKGQMVLILGQSGAGKTTFMHAVNGYEKADGMITYNNRTIEEIRETGGGIGFVPQGDLLRPGLSVYSTLKSAARLKLNESGAAIKEKVEQTLQLMGLSAKRKELVSKLSGGEKKRLAVAMEYIGDPELFFLDEPDSGLDGPSSRNLMGLLRTIADEGRIVMLISHIPDRGGSMFDRIVVLGKNPQTQCGGLAFYGSYQKALDFFGVDRLEDIVGALDKNGKNKADYFIKKYAESGAGREGMV